MTQVPTPIAAPFLRGATAHLDAWRYMEARRELWRYVTTPMIVTAVVAVGLYAIAFTAGWQAIGQLMGHVPSWAAWSAPVLRALLVIALLAATGFLVTRCGVVIGAPWYGRLAEVIAEASVEEAGGDAALSLSRIASEIGRAARDEAEKLGLTLLVLTPALLLNLLPVVGSLAATAIGTAWAVVMANLDFTDAPLARRRMTFRQKLRWVLADPAGSAGFALVAIALTGLPLVNFLTVPLSMAAGTLRYIERERPGDQEVA